MNKIIEFGNWDASDTVLSLGCGSGWWEVNLICQNPAQELILVDEQPAVLNQSDLQETVAYFEKQVGIRCETACTLINCDAGETGLSHKSVDQIWLFNSLHEMENPKAVVEECARVLVSEGLVIVEEILASYAEEIHEGCGKTLFDREELVKLFDRAGFAFVADVRKDDVATYLKFQKEI
jgi:ubiquinone/menaquinone biosynthesis C-methylase UbiE